MNSHESNFRAFIANLRAKTSMNAAEIQTAADEFCRIWDARRNIYNVRLNRARKMLLDSMDVTNELPLTTGVSASPSDTKLKETKEEPSPQTPYKKKEKKACENNSNACAREDDSPDMQRAATSSHFVKPTLAEVAAYIAEKHYPFDAEEFWNFYESNGWRVGRNPMKSWKAACVTWKKSRDRDKERRDHIDARMSEREAARQKHIDERIAQRSENRRAGYDCDADDDAPYYTGSDYIRKCIAEFKAEQRRNGNV